MGQNLAGEITAPPDPLAEFIDDCIHKAASPQ